MALVPAVLTSGGVWQPALRWAAASLHTSSALEAARKGTRAKAEAKKKAAKKEVVKREFIPLKKRLELQETGGLSPRRREDHLKTPIDDVWITKFYKWKVYNVNDAITMHKEAHHPTLIGRTDALLHAFIELDMTADKKNRFIDDFYSVVRLPHDFHTEQEKTVLVISRNEEVLQKAREMGATHAAGLDIIKQAQNGEINLKEFQHFVAETDILPDLVAIRGLMRKRFPTVRSGTAGSDILPIIERFTKGVEYKTTKDKYHHDYATIQVPFGRLDMSNEQLEENISALLNDVERQRPTRKLDGLVTLAKIKCPPSKEQFKIDHSLYILDKTKPVKAAAAI